MSLPLLRHPRRDAVLLQLKQNLILREISSTAWDALEPLLEVADYRKGDPLLHQGTSSMEQFFIVEGILKRSVSNAEGKEMILRFAAETDMDTSYAAWRLHTSVPYSIVAVTAVRAAHLSMPQWVEFLDAHPDIKKRFEYEVMRLMSEVMAHTITLHLLDAPGRLARFERKHPELLGRIPNKELASYLNLTPETLSRLKQRRRSGTRRSSLRRWRPSRSCWCRVASPRSSPARRPASR